MSSAIKASCEPWCASPCASLNGDDLTIECGACAIDWINCYSVTAAAGATTASFAFTGCKAATCASMAIDNSDRATSCCH